MSKEPNSIVYVIAPNHVLMPKDYKFTVMAIIMNFIMVSLGLKTKNILPFQILSMKSKLELGTNHVSLYLCN